MKRKCLQSTFCIATLAVLAGTAGAQSADTIDQVNRAAERQQQLERKREDEQFQKDRSSAVPPARLPVPAIASPGKDKGPCRDVREVRVQGVTLLNLMRLDAIVQPYRQRCLGVSDIEGLLTDLTRAYVDSGWIMARVYLPAQDLSTGVLTVTVVEGKVSGIEVNDEAAKSISLGNVAPFTVGQPLNIRDFEQALDQINRLASNSATLAMRPGEGVGDTVVVLSNQPRSPWHGSVSFDTEGSASTGRRQAGVTVALDNPLRLNDFVSLTHRSSVLTDDGQGSNSDSVSYVLPFGYTTLSVNLARSNYESVVTTGAGTILHNSGDSATNALRLEHVLMRDATTRWNASANLATQKNRSFLDGTLLETASRRLTVLDLGTSVSTVLAGGALSLDLGNSQGLPILNAQRDAGLPESAPHAQFRKWTLGGSYMRPFEALDREWTWNAQASAQKASTVLYGSQQILVGSQYSVRGFTDSTISGDHGYYLRNELGTRVPFGEGEQAGSVRPFVALDVGKAWSINPGQPDGVLVGAAAGLQFRMRNGLSLDLSVAAPLSKPDFLRRESPTASLRLSVSL